MMHKTPKPVEPRWGGPPWAVLVGVVAALSVLVDVLYPSWRVADLAAAETVLTEPAPQGQQAPKPAQKPLPPLPFAPQMARPADAVRVAYEFVGRHPEVASFVPCFCGCESGGHRSNDHCFVRTRATDGSVLAWEPHGLECATCIDVARDSAQMYALGASVKDIRKAIDQKYASRFPTHTPTPQPK